MKVYKGVSIYPIRGSQYWQVRVWDSSRQKYTTRSTGETSRIEARKVASEFALSLNQSERVERQLTFRHFAEKAIAKASRLVTDGERNIGTAKAMKWAIQNPDWGLVKWFGA
ncbi:MAG: hypothetical protein WA850_20840, partial [Xanthobacteraceae bacterium]